MGGVCIINFFIGSSLMTLLLDATPAAVVICAGVNATWLPPPSPLFAADIILKNLVVHVDDIGEPPRFVR
jgi:hypothetical protein